MLNETAFAQQHSHSDRTATDTPILRFPNPAFQCLSLFLSIATLATGLYFGQLLFGLFGSVQNLPETAPKVRRMDGVPLGCTTVPSVSVSRRVFGVGLATLKVLLERPPPLSPFLADQI